MDLKKLKVLGYPMSSEYSKWLSTLPDMEGCLESKSPLSIALEGLVLDLQVVQADLFGSQGLLSGIAKRLQELEVLAWERLQKERRT